MGCLALELGLVAMVWRWDFSLSVSESWNIIPVAF